MTGNCHFGDKCRNKHCDDAEAERTLAKWRSTPCRFGAQCRNVDCVYLHEGQAPDDRPGVRQTARGVVGVTVIKGDAVIAEPPSELRASPEEASQPDAKLVLFPPSASLVTRSSGAGADGAVARADVGAAVGSVRIPSDIWVADWKRNPGVFALNPDPMQRLSAVNASSPKGVLDLHYQTVDQVIAVLQASLARRGIDWDYYDEDARSLWIVTGAGNHTLAKGRALLFDVVHDYLRSTRLRWKVGKDNSGAAGAFLVEGLGDS